MGDGTMPLDWGKNPQADWSRWLASDNARINAANELLKARAHIRELEAQLAAAEAAGVAKGLEMAAARIHLFHGDGKYAGEKDVELCLHLESIIRALSPPTGMVLVPREPTRKMCEAGAYSEIPKPGDDLGNAAKCYRAMIGAARE